MVAKENGATLVGGKRSGRFSHEMVGGEYRMVGQTVIVTISEKHWLLPWPPKGSTSSTPARATPALEVPHSACHC